MVDRFRGRLAGAVKGERGMSVPASEAPRAFPPRTP